MSELAIEEQWKNFKEKFGRLYEGEEETKRFAIFKENVKKIKEHNKRYETGEVTWEEGINQFTDLTFEEYKKFLGGCCQQSN